MATKKLKNFEYAGHTEAGPSGMEGLCLQDAFDTPNGFVFVVTANEDHSASENQLVKIFSERIRYYLDNEILENPTEAVSNAMIYSNGYIFEYLRKIPKISPGELSGLCVLIRDEKVYYGWIGEVCLFLFTGKKFYQLASCGQKTREEDGQAAVDGDGFIGSQQFVVPGNCQQPYVPVNGDRLIAGTGGLCRNFQDKTFKKLLRDSMPTQTKVLRLANIAGNTGGKEPMALQLINFYNLVNTLRSFAPATHPGPPETNSSKVKKVFNEKKSSPVMRYLFTAIVLLLVGYMVYDLFIYNPRPARHVPLTQEHLQADHDSLIKVRGVEISGTPEQLPEDVSYTVRSGDAWSRIYQQFGVCSWFIRNHPPNQGKFDSEGNPVAGSTLQIPVMYSGRPQLNPYFYREFQTSRVGGSCEHADEDFLRRFEEKIYD